MKVSSMERSTSWTSCGRGGRLCRLALLLQLVCFLAFAHGCSDFSERVRSSYVKDGTITETCDGEFQKASTAKKFKVSMYTGSPVDAVALKVLAATSPTSARCQLKFEALTEMPDGAAAQKAEKPFFAAAPALTRFRDDFQFDDPNTNLCCRKTGDHHICVRAKDEHVRFKFRVISFLNLQTDLSYPRMCGDS